MVDPGRGGNIQSVRSSHGQREWIFFDPARRPNQTTGAEPYDDVWCGGFEELFPNDAPGPFEGRDLPDHGELWSVPLEVSGRGDLSVALRRECRTVPALFEKRITLDPRVAAFRLDYRITNRGSGPLAFLFKLHPALALEPGDRLLLPGGRVDAVDPSFGTHFGPGTCKWPDAPSRGGGTFDLSEVPGPSARAREFVYVSDLPEGWCGLERRATGERIIFHFPLRVFPYCWLFLTYGGWRDYYTAVLEPCTNMPKDLSQARAAGRCAVLDAGAVLECSVNVAIEPAHA